MGTCWDCGMDGAIVGGNRCEECAHTHVIRLYLLKVFITNALGDVPVLEEFPERSDPD